MNFFEEESFFSKQFATGIKFASKSDWNFESSRKVQIWIFLNETDGFLKKKEVFKISKGSKFGVECNWISKISQNIRKLAFVWSKRDWFFEKKSWVFQRPLRAANLLENATHLVRFLKTFTFWIFEKKISISKEKAWVFSKPLKAAISL